MSGVYRIAVARQAERELLRLPPAIQRRVEARIDDLGARPRPHAAVALTGLRNTYRIRVGDWRIVYEVRDAVLVVLVLRVGHRREVYRRLD